MARLEAVLIAVLRRVDRVLQVVLPVRAQRVCYQSIPDFTDNAYYTFRHALLTRDGLEHVWLVRDRAVVARIEREFAEILADRPGHGHRLRVLRKQSLSGYLAYLTSRNVFHTHGVYVFSDAARARNVVAVWHGMPIKAIGRLNEATPNTRPPFATASIATSQLYRGIMADVFGIDASAVEVCGQPRCDVFRSRAARGTEADEVRRRLGVPPDRKLVLWMPTYREDGGSFIEDLPVWGLAELQAASEATGCTLVVKLHPFDILNRASSAFDGFDGIEVIRSDDWLQHGMQLYDLVATSDALLSDISSVLIDFIDTDRPIGTFAFDEERYDRDPVVPFSRLFGSARFHRLLGPDDVHAFMRDVADGRLVRRQPGDFAAALHEELPGSSAEAVLKRFGL